MAANDRETLKAEAEQMVAQAKEEARIWAEFFKKPEHKKWSAKHAKILIEAVNLKVLRRFFTRKPRQINIGLGEVLIAEAGCDNDYIVSLLILDATSLPGAPRELVAMEKAKDHELLTQINFHTPDSIEMVIESLTRLKSQMKTREDLESTEDKVC